MRAVFLDRDGVVNELVYFPEVGVIDTPMTPSQFRLAPDAGRAIKRLNRMELRVIVASNQPGLAKRKMTASNFQRIRAKMTKELSKEGAHVDAEYYCFHHPLAQNKKYRKNCQCRKPKPGMLFRAAKDLDIDLKKSFMVGDSLTDIEAGKRAGCTTILLGSTKGDLFRFMKGYKMVPDIITPTFSIAAREIETQVK